MNKVLIMGRLTRDPDLKPIGQTQLCTFGLAVTTKFSAEKGETCFVDCKAWSKRGEAINQYFNKGSQILIEGRLCLERWEDQNGNKRSKHTINVDNFHFTESKANSNQNEPDKPNSKQNGMNDDEIPF